MKLAVELPEHIAFAAVLESDGGKLNHVPSSLRDEIKFSHPIQPLRSWLISVAASRLLRPGVFALKCLRCNVAAEVHAVEMDFLHGGAGGYRGE